MGWLGERCRWGGVGVLVALGGAACVNLHRPSARVGPDAAMADAPLADGAGSDASTADSALDAGADVALEVRPPDDEPPLPPIDGGPDATPLDATTGAGADASSPFSRCTPLLEDGFESGTLASWDRTYGDAPRVVSAGAIAGSRSLASALGDDNAAARTLPAATGLRLSFVVDLSMMTTTGSIPLLAGLRNPDLGHDPIGIYFGRDGDGPIISVRANYGASAFERISFARLPATRVALRIEWQAQTASSAGAARLHIDGTPFWTSPALANMRDTVTELRLGNTGSAGTGTVLYDGVLLESCQ